MDKNKLKKTYGFDKGSYKYIAPGAEILKYIGQIVILVDFKKDDEGKWTNTMEKVLIDSIREYDAVTMTYNCIYKTEDKKKQEIVFETEDVSSFEESFDEFKSYKMKALGTSENITEAATAKITKCINDILEAEAPMNKKSLAKKTFSCWGISRPGTNMKALFETAFEKADKKVTSAGENEYVWLSSQVPE